MPCIAGNARLRLAADRPNGRDGRASRRPTLWSALRRWRHDSLAMAALHALDECILKDIGIERSEIQYIVYGSGRDASRVKRT